MLSVGVLDYGLALGAPLAPLRRLGAGGQALCHELTSTLATPFTLRKARPTEALHDTTTRDLVLDTCISATYG